MNDNTISRIWPKSEEVMSWDPENMEKYWRLCERYDKPAVTDNFDLLSRRAFKSMSQTGKMRS